MYIVVHDSQDNEIILILGHGDKIVKTDQKNSSGSMVEYSIPSKERQYFKESIGDIKEQLIMLVRDADSI